MPRSHNHIHALAVALNSRPCASLWGPTIPNQPLQPATRLAFSLKATRVELPEAEGRRRVEAGVLKELKALRRRSKK